MVIGCFGWFCSLFWCHGVVTLFSTFEFGCSFWYFFRQFDNLKFMLHFISLLNLLIGTIKCVLNNYCLLIKYFSFYYDLFHKNVKRVHDDQNMKNMWVGEGCLTFFCIWQNLSIFLILIDIQLRTLFKKKCHWWGFCRQNVRLAWTKCCSYYLWWVYYPD